MSAKTRTLTLNISNQSESCDLQYYDLYMKEGAPADPLLKPGDVPRGKDVTVQFSNSPNPRFGISGIVTYRHGEAGAGLAISFLLPVNRQEIPDDLIFSLRLLPSLRDQDISSHEFRHPDADLYVDMIRKPLDRASGNGVSAHSSSVLGGPHSSLTVILTDTR